MVPNDVWQNKTTTTYLLFFYVSWFGCFPGDSLRE